MGNFVTAFKLFEQTTLKRVVFVELNREGSCNNHLRLPRTKTKVIHFFFRLHLAFENEILSKNEHICAFFADHSDLAYFVKVHTDHP